MGQAEEHIEQFHKGVLADLYSMKVDGLAKINAFHPGIFGTRFPQEDLDKYLGHYSYVHACAASAKTRPETLRFVLENGGQELIDKPDHKGRTPLFLAMSHSRPEIVETLIAKGADTSPAALGNTTPLHFECIRTHTEEAARAVIARHPDTFLLKNSMGYTPLDYLLKWQNDTGARHDLLINCAREGVLSHPAHGRWVPLSNDTYPVLADISVLCARMGTHPDLDVDSRKFLVYGTDKMKAAVIAQSPENLVQKDSHGKAVLDYIIEANLQFSGVREYLPDLLIDCARADLLVHPANGVWLPKDKSVYGIVLSNPTRKFLTNFFNPEYWEGHEHAALALRDDMLEYFKSAAGVNSHIFLSMIEEFDFTPLEREAQAREHREGARGVSRFLRKPSSPGSGSPGVG